MAVLELKADVTLEAVPALEDLLAEREELRLIVLEDQISGRVWLMGYFESRGDAMSAWRDLVGAADTAWAKIEPVVRELPDADWKNSYKAHFKAWKFGRLNWVPVWERETFVLPVGEEVLWLDPGMAFGTGNHETTRLVVERMVKFSDQCKLGAGVIDAGCGSGILALSAVKLGYREVVAFDNDPEAVQVGKENAALNDLAGRVEFFVGDLVSGLAGRKAELVLANIQADVLMKHARGLLGAVAPAGVLVLSGILAIESAQVRDAFGAFAPDWTADTRLMGEWSDLVFEAPDS
ncbi:MAG: methyltransferase domain-containing protein [Lacunisphaera sp.]|nr:methyltransferase domain-containing protein [Lacunisphaera sp.]